MQEVSPFREVEKGQVASLATTNDKAADYSEVRSEDVVVLVSTVKIMEAMKNIAVAVVHYKIAYAGAKSKILKMHYKVFR